MTRIFLTLTTFMVAGSAQAHPGAHMNPHGVEGIVVLACAVLIGAMAAIAARR